MGIRAVRSRRYLHSARALWQGGNLENAWTLAQSGLDLLPQVPSTRLNAVADRVAALETLAQFTSDLSNQAQTQQYCNDALALLEPLKRGVRRDKWLVAILVLKGNSQRLSGNHGDATHTLGRALALSEQAPNPPSLSTAPLNALGILSKDRGLYEEAEKYYIMALDLLVCQVGKNAPELAGVYHNLAGLAHVQGSFSEAEEPARQAIQLRQSAHLVDAAGLAADLSVLGAVLAGQKRWDEASDVLTQSLTLWRSRYGNEHYEVAVQLHNLAAIEQAKGNYSSAEVALEQALTIKRRILGGSHPEVAALFNNLATVYVDTGRHQEAAEYYDRAVATFTQTLGPDHPSTVACIQNRKNLDGSI